MTTNKLKWAAILCFVVALGGLLVGGFLTRNQLAPYPGRVVDPAGTVRFTKDRGDTQILLGEIGGRNLTMLAVRG